MLETDGFQGVARPAFPGGRDCHRHWQIEVVSGSPFATITLLPGRLVGRAIDGRFMGHITACDEFLSDAVKSSGIRVNGLPFDRLGTSGISRNRPYRVMFCANIKLVLDSWLSPFPPDGYLRDWEMDRYRGVRTYCPLPLSIPLR